MVHRLRRRRARPRARGTAARSVHARTACTMSSPRNRTDSTRRRRVPPTPPAACSVSMWKNTTSPGSSSHPITRKRSGSASISGSSASDPSGNHLAWPSRNERGMNHGPRCEPFDELAASIERHRVDREPHRDVLAAVDVVVRQVLMPRRPLRVPGSFTSTWSWYSRTGRWRRSAPRRSSARRRLADELLELGDPLPVAEVLDERAVAVGARPLRVGDSDATGWLRSPPRPARPIRRPRTRRARTPRRPARSRLRDRRDLTIAHRHAPPVIGMRTPRSVGHLDRPVVAGVDVTDHAHAGVGWQHPLELLGGQVGAVGDARPCRRGSTGRCRRRRRGGCSPTSPR